MTPADLLKLLADRLNVCGHPAIRSTQILPNSPLKVVFGDASEMYVKVAHVTPADRSAPEKPTFPAQPAMPGEDPVTVNPDAAQTGMQPGYFTGLARHLLTVDQPAQIGAVALFSDTGAKGYSWAPHGLRVDVGGQAVYLSVARGSAPLGDDKAMPDTFTEEDLNVPALRS